ncbi:MAG: hypothetical protein KJ833_09565 [Alphaproteobacteria bacterium]|uniref:hypothetical protein n=1 Tax=Hyphomonas sp. TaxID=87 RepID=UPI001DC970F0|nr:hypothetical protein [Hyphomonas sp.]MBU3921944.1 hypothetical protein [Alphaproteobacteria bacterium]MBU4063678.1 hypothetical protein [Alphaproteobacteria bacterium]MBU4164361.1 hypothetical protein [Alphaproteobacteria bacterium]MBU4569196.1 hypothetical protein [Alphaproteobacteria bacterium]
MTHRILYLGAVLLMAVSAAGTAAADQGRLRSGAQRAANAAVTVQQGRGNAAGIAQTGAGNTAGLVQLGHNNTGAILQAGSGNEACLIQAGRNLDGGIQQVGDNLTTGVLQNRWGTADIPVDVCATATTRRDLAAYMPQRSEESFRARRFRQDRIEP